jgi:hypothetical protein
LTILSSIRICVASSATRGGDLHDLAFLHDPLVLLVDQFCLGIEIGDMVAILDLHRLAPDGRFLLDKGKRRFDFRNRRRDRLGFSLFLLDLPDDGGQFCQTSRTAVGFPACSPARSALRIASVSRNMTLLMPSPSPRGCTI